MGVDIYFPKYTGQTLTTVFHCQGSLLVSLCQGLCSVLESVHPLASILVGPLFSVLVSQSFSHLLLNFYDKFVGRERRYLINVYQQIKDIFIFVK